MRVFNADSIRNVAVIAHGGAGKTSLVDAALYDAGAGARQGKVDEGSSVSDYDPDEQKRRISINLTPLPLEWRNAKINFLDTPGYADLVGEVMAGLRVADAALLVVSAEKGVEVGAELVWGYADEHDLPRLVFVNKLDRENTTYDRALDSLRARFGNKLAPLTIPIGQAAGFSGVVDLVSGKAYSYAADKMTEREVPAEMRDAIGQYRDKLVEVAVESDDDLMNKYLEGEEISGDELRRAVRAASASGSLVPVLAGSAAKNIGVQNLLDAITDYLPSAAERPGVDPDGQPCAFVFKTIVDPQKGTYSYFRVYSGTFKSDAHVFNSDTATDERLGQILMMRGKSQEPVPELHTGDIGAVVKLSKTHTGNTLGSKDCPKLDPIHVPQPAYTAAVYPKTQSDLDKMGVALARLGEEDPSLHISRDPETAETLLSGMGESHIDIALERMQRRFGVDVLKRERRVPYRETIRKKARAEGRHKKQTGGHGQFGDVWLEVEPLPDAEKDYVFENKIVGGVVPKEYVPGVEKGVAESLREGFLAGYPMVHVRVMLVDGKYHDVDSSSQAFEIAARLGMKEAVALANPTLLEPIMNVTIIAPDDNMGDISSDLNTKRARILGMEPAGQGLQRISAQVPMAEMLRYATDLRSITQGRAHFSMEVAGYEEVPANVQQGIIEAHKKELAEK
ncbi:MAG TPA: elongation factor G [Ktedonobacterales bacterium]|nr:elongation factor G [Ktedonobacterales bacterium]